MSVIKSHSVGNGDMFYIEHNSDNLTIIDCCLNGDTHEEILDDIASLKSQKSVVRFISTHPDDDHLRGLELLDDRINIRNFYCVANDATKTHETDSFKRYCELRDSEAAFHIRKGCTRKWMNQKGDGRGSSGVSILWPDPQNEFYQEALELAAEGGCPNNISTVIQYSVKNGATVLWMGDLETGFMEAIEDKLNLPLVDILFAPHHGRDSGRVPSSMLEAMSPRLIVVGEAPSEHIHYYPGYNTITQNRAGDIVFECETNAVHVFTSEDYEADFLEKRYQRRRGYFYAGTIDLTSRSRGVNSGSYASEGLNAAF
jgi:beta-lactamase superfamily II metal-dependent hydrolase